MEKVRIGNDLRVNFSVYRDGEPESFDGATNISTKIVNESYNKTIAHTYSIVGNVVQFEIDALELKQCGKCRVFISYTKAGDYSVDSPAFELVQHTEDTGGTEVIGIEIVKINISGDIGINRDGASAYEVWESYPGNEGKTIEQYFEWLRENPTKIDLDGLNSNIDKLHFKPDTLVQLSNIGDVRYSPESKTLEVKVSDTVSIQLGQEMQTRVKNDEAIQINNGQMVYINSAVGANPLAKIASTSNSDIAQRTFGMATENIPANGFGAITTEGLVRDINTSAFTEGSMLWLGANGSFTNIEPTAPTSKISVGMVLRANANNGIVYVKIRAIARNQKLSDVYAPTLTGGDVLRWNNATLRFEAFNITSALSNKVDTSRTITAGNGLTGGGALSGDVTVNVGNTDDSIAVGTDGIKVDTQNSLTSTSTTKPLSAAQGKALQDNKAEKTRTITAGNGLTGGGDLTADRTININPADDSLTVTADNVKVNTNNTLTSTSTTQPLSANQGKVLNEKVVQVETDLNIIDGSVVEHNEVVKLSDSINTGAFISKSGVHTPFNGYSYNTYSIVKSGLVDYYVSAISNGSSLYYANYYNVNGSFIGSEYPITNGSSLSKAKLTIPEGAVTLKLNYQSGAFLYCDTKTYENLPEKLNNKLNKDDTTYQKIVSALNIIKTLDYTSIVNTLVNSDGTDNAVFVNQGYWYAIYPVEKSDTKRYYLTLKYTTGSGFYAANYYDINGTLLGHEYAVGTLDITKAVLTIPTGAVTMKVNYFSNLGLPIVYLDDSTIIEDVSGKLDDINDEIKAINSSSAFYKKMEITKNPNSIYIRSKYDDTRDLVIVYKIMANNKYFSPYSSYIGLATDATSNIVASNVVHYTHDSTPPISTYNYWFISGEHGYIVPKVVSTGHNKTSADIGSWWKTADNKYFQLAGIDGTSLILVPKITIDGGGTGKDVSDYSHGITVLTTLTHISGATNTSDITVTTMGSIQLYSSTHNISKKFYCDGIEITDNGVYKCNEFSVTDVHEVINPTSITQYYPTIIASSVMARNSFTYKFTGLSCFISNMFEVINRPIWLIYYGAMQPLGLTSTGDYHSYIFIPKVKSITNGEITTDWKYPQDCTNPNQTWAKTTFSNNVDDLMLVDDLPERIIQFYKSPTTNQFLIGFAAGYSLLSSSTVNSKRKNLTKTAFNFAPNISNKFYSRVIEGSKFADSLLPIGTVLNFNYYYTYFKPSDICQTYWYKEGNSWIVYAHSHAEQLCNIELPDLMESMIATIIEKTTDTELLTDTVVNNKLIAKFPVGANYLVIKLN